MLTMPPDPAGAGTHGSAFAALKTFIVSTTGHARLAERDDLLMERIGRRMASHGLPSIESYLDLLRRGAGGRTEFDRLIAELTIGETSFFRHREQFDALRDAVLPARLRGNAATRQLRIWSAGCANGAEAYSLAILVHDLLGDRRGDWSIVIVGSDINRALLAEAERGEYSAWTLRDIAPEQRSRLFVRSGESWAVRDEYRRGVEFVYHNLVGEEFPCVQKNIFSFDIIMCRNVMIYLDARNNRLLAERLGSMLVEDGWLFTAPADFNPHLEHAFTLEKVAGAICYRRRRARMSAGIAAPATPPPVAVAGNDAAGIAPAPAQRAVPDDRAVPRRCKPAKTTPAPTSPEASRPGIDAIIALADRGDWVAAARHCEALLEADACNAPAYYFYALVQQQSGAARAAERALKRALYLDGNFALAHYQLGLARKDARDTAQCRRSFRNVLGALRGLPDAAPVSPCGRVTARDLRNLATQQLALLGPQRRGTP